MDADGACESGYWKNQFYGYEGVTWKQVYDVLIADISSNKECCMEQPNCNDS